MSQRPKITPCFYCKEPLAFWEGKGIQRMVNGVHRRFCDEECLDALRVKRDLIKTKTCPQCDGMGTRNHNGLGGARVVRQCADCLGEGRVPCP